MLSALDEAKLMVALAEAIEVALKDVEDELNGVLPNYIELPGEMAEAALSVLKRAVIEFDEKSEQGGR